MLGKPPVPRRSTNLDIVEQGPTALTVAADRFFFFFFNSRQSFLSSFSLSGRRPDID